MLISYVDLSFESSFSANDPRSLIPMHHGSAKRERQRSLMAKDDSLVFATDARDWISKMADIYNMLLVRICREGALYKSHGSG